jgi:hypothetical protein
MGQHRGCDSGDDLFGVERSAPPAPRFRYRVVLGAKAAWNGEASAEPGRRRGESLVVVWVTNDLAYARELAARINAHSQRLQACVQAWNRADAAAQSRWVLRWR